MRFTDLEYCNCNARLRESPWTGTRTGHHRSTIKRTQRCCQWPIATASRTMSLPSNSSPQTSSNPPEHPISILATFKPFVTHPFTSCSTKSSEYTSVESHPHGIPHGQLCSNTPPSPPKLKSQPFSFPATPEKMPPSTRPSIFVPFYQERSSSPDDLSSILRRNRRTYRHYNDSISANPSANF